MSQELNSFEAELLGELREHVAGRPARARRRRAVVGSGAAAVMVSAMLGASLLAPTAAYAVSENGAGDVVVRVHELSDAAGLEAALAKHGITAKVDYQNAAVSFTPLPAGVKPGGNPTEITLTPTTVGGLPVTAGGPSAGTPAVDSSPGWSLEEFQKRCGIQNVSESPAAPEVTMEQGDAVVTIPRDSVPIGQTLSITTMGGDQSLTGLSVTWQAPGGASCGIVSVTAGIEPKR